MKVIERIPNQSLLDAALSLMSTIGKPLEKMPTGTRAMKYKLADGKTARARACNDHVLVVMADSAEPGASLNIEGTDFLLVVMPEIPRQAGAVIVYFVPTSIAVEDVRRAHADWLASKPSTKGNNRTWNIWFGDGPTTSAGFALKWFQYRVSGRATAQAPSPREERSLGAVIARARSEIANAAGVPVEAVKITIALD